MFTSEELTGKVQTVSGLVAPEVLGVTLPHEHLIIDFRVVFKEPKYASDRYKAIQPVSINNLEWVRHNRTSNYDNLLLGDEKEAIAEAFFFKKEGGGAIVDVSNKTFGRDPLALARISRATGLYVIMGAGYFVSDASQEVSFFTEEEIYNEFVKEFKDGVDGTGIKIGVIGELGCTWPLKQEEKKVLSAAAKAQKSTGLAISIHPGQHPDSPFEIIDFLASAGAHLEHVIMGHIERTLLSFEAIENLLKKGCYVEFDAFGKEGYFSSAAKHDLSIDIPNDHLKINMIKNLIQNGYGEKLLVSQDICTKDMTVTYGGYGYAHILKRAVPIMRLKGLTDDDIFMITCNNPQKAFTIF